MTAKRWNEATTIIRYERSGDLIRLKLQSLTNHELREVLIGLWCRLDAADRADHIKAIHHYSEDPDAYLSPVAAAVKAGEMGESSINLKALADRGERIKP